MVEEENVAGMNQYARELFIFALATQVAGWGSLECWMCLDVSGSSDQQ
jgi:hypothetical protein